MSLVGRVTTGFGLLLVLFAAGCGPTDTIGTTLPVSGKVAIDDKPLESGAVNFVPDEAKGNKVAVAVTGTVTGGQFTLQTTSANGVAKAGAPPGWYKVTIQTMAATGAMETKPDPNKPSVTPSMPKMTPIAQKYTNPAQTPLLIEVKEGGSYELKATSR